MTRILQINLGGGSSAQNLATQTAAEHSADIIIASEYYKYGRIPDNWYCDTSNRAAVIIASPLPVEDYGAEDGYAWIKLGDTRIYSCYWSPNFTMTEYEDFLR